GKYSAVQWEAKGLLEVIRRLKPFISGELNVIFETDSSAVASILKHAGDDQLTKIAIHLSEEGVKAEQLRHVPGVDNALADWASRLPAKHPDRNESTDGFLVFHVRETADSGVITAADQHIDESLRKCIASCEAIVQAHDDTVDSPGEFAVRESMHRFRMVDGLLYRLEFGSETDPDCPPRLIVVVPQHRQHQVM
ncbi:hypothetical protein GGI24_005526, partial [Coemansia furcata]